MTYVGFWLTIELTLCNNTTAEKIEMMGSEIDLVLAFVAVDLRLKQNTGWLFLPEWHQSKVSSNRCQLSLT